MNSRSAKSLDSQEGFAVEHYEKKRKVEIVLLGAVLPFVLFTVLMVLYTFMWHKRPVIPRVVTVLAAQICIISAWPTGPGAATQRVRRFSDWWPLLSAVFAIICAVSCGALAAAEMGPWVRAHYFTEYSNVDAVTGLPHVFADAGIIHFMPATALDTDRSAGFTAGWHRYCAAPVIHPNLTDEPVVFWAVGRDCCEARGDFSCGDARDDSARRGLFHSDNARSWLFGSNEADHYHAAVKMAAAVYEYTLPEGDPILLEWLKDPELVASEYWWAAVTICVVSTCCALILCSYIGWRFYRASNV